MMVFYLLIGIYLVSRWWAEQGLKKLKYVREFPEKVFPEENVTIHLKLYNTSHLPILWLLAHDSLPIGLATPNFHRSVISIRGKEKTQLNYHLRTHKRGYYQIGPLFLRTGDFLGLSEEVEQQGTPDYLTVYPQVYEFQRFNVSSHSPYGNLKHTQPVFEDPSRVIGKRDFQTGDSLRSVDWKATAITGKLTVRTYEPTISLETIIFLNLNPNDYPTRTKLYDIELAITLTASIANWVITRRQSVGLLTNGSDLLDPQNSTVEIPIRKSRQHLMRVLESLARIQVNENQNFIPLITRKIQEIPWGSTIVIITGNPITDLLDIVFQARRSGKDCMICIIGKPPDLSEFFQKAAQFSVRVEQLVDERELQQW